MARPKKHPLERRLASVRCDLTLAEKRYVQQQCAQAGLSEAEYTRRRVLGFAVKAAAAPARFDPALVSEINRLALQLSALGNLANQVARACHTDRRLPAGYGELPSRIKRLLRLVEQALEKTLGDGP